VAPSRVLVDINVLLDVILDRKPWADDATLLLDAIATGRVSGHVAGHALTTVYHLVDREQGRGRAVTAVSDLLGIFTVVPLGNDEFHRALALGLSDYEDAVQVAACLAAGADVLVTRNEKDFKGAPVTLRTPGELLALLGPNLAR
jgi:predicted nucleic acid-binding protein